MQVVIQTAAWLNPLFAASHKKLPAAKTDASLYLAYCTFLKRKKHHPGPQRATKTLFRMAVATAAVEVSVVALFDITKS